MGDTVNHPALRLTDYLIIGGRPQRTRFRVWQGISAVQLLRVAPQVLQILAPVPALHFSRRAHRDFEDDRAGRYPRGYGLESHHHFPSFGVSAEGDIIQYVDPGFRAVPLRLEPAFPIPAADLAARIIIVALQPPSELQGMPTPSQCLTVAALAAWLAEHLRVPAGGVWLDPMFAAAGSALTLYHRQLVATCWSPPVIVAKIPKVRPPARPKKIRDPNNKGGHPFNPLYCPGPIVEEA